VQRPRSDAHVSIDDALGWQAEFCRAHQAPISAAFIDAVRASPELVSGHLPPTTRAGDLLGLRVLAAANRVARAHVADGLTDQTPRTFADSVVESMIRHPEGLAEELTRIPQTNEVGRSRPLRIALSHIHTPVRLFEVGASAGLNLRADHLAGDAAHEVGPMPRIIERRGCDLHPIDPTTREGVERLEARVWLDHPARLAALHAACEVARHVPAEVVARDAVEFVREIELVDGVTTVVWHSAFIGYLDEPSRSTFEDVMAALAAQSTPTAAFLRVAWEPVVGTDRFGLTVSRWSGGPDGRLLTRSPLIGDAHGGELEFVESVLFDD
jgi:hypothetical protein